MRPSPSSRPTCLARSSIARAKRACTVRQLEAAIASSVDATVLYRGPVLRHSAELIQAANFRSAVAF